MKQIFTFPDNQTSAFIDPDYVGDSNSGFTRRMDDLREGNYLPWLGLDPVADLGRSTNQLMANVSKFNNYYYSTRSGDNISMYDFWNKPLVKANKKLIDAEVVSLGDVTSDTTKALFTFTNTHEFTEDMQVIVSGLNNSASELNGNRYFVNIIDTDTIALKLTTSGPLVRFYNLESASGVTAAVGAPVLFTDSSHDLVSGTSVLVDNFDGTVGDEHNGTNLYAQVIDSSTFNLSYDSAGTNLLGIQPILQDVSVDSFKLFEDGRIKISMYDQPLFFNQTEIDFNAGDPDQIFNNLMPGLGTLYLSDGGIANKIYTLYADMDLNTLTSWRDFDYLNTFATKDTPIIKSESYGSEYYLYVDADTGTWVSGISLDDGTLLDGFDPLESYYSIDNVLHTSTTGFGTDMVNVTHWELKNPVNVYNGYASSAVDRVSHNSQIYNEDNTAQLSNFEVPIVTYQLGGPTLNLNGISRVNYELPGTDATSFSLTATNRTYDFPELYTYPENIEVTGFTSGYPNINRIPKSFYNNEYQRDYLTQGYAYQYDDMYVISDWETLSRDEKDSIVVITESADITSINPLFNVFENFNTNEGSPIGRAFIASNQGWQGSVLNNTTNIKVVLIPFARTGVTTPWNPAGSSEPAWLCRQMYLDNDGRPQEIVRGDDWHSTADSGPWFYQYYTSFYNPVYTNMDRIGAALDGQWPHNEVDVTPAYAGSFGYEYSTSHLMNSGTIVTAATRDYVVIRTGTTEGGDYIYAFFPYVNGVIDWRPYDTPEAHQINVQLPYNRITTDGLTYFEIVSSTYHPAYKVNFLNPTGDFTRDNLLMYDKWKQIRDRETDHFNYVLLAQDTYSAATADVGRPVTDSTTGTVVENRIPDDAGQIQLADLTNSTTGDVAVDDPYPYEIEEVNIFIGGNQKFSYKDVNNVTTYAAQVDPYGYWTEGGTQRTNYTATGETPAEFTVTVDGNGRLSGVTLVSGEGPEGRYADGAQILLPIRYLPNEYVAPVVTPAEQQDNWDTADQWDTDGYDKTKLWPTHIAPTGIKITTAQPSVINRSQNGTKYVRSLGLVKQQLEVSYPPMSYDDFRQFEATVEAARGQATPFYLQLRDVGVTGNNLLMARKTPSTTNELRINQPVSTGDKTVLLEGFASFESSAIATGEALVLDAGYANGGVVQVINSTDANVFGEAKIRIPYAARNSLPVGRKIYKDPYQIIVTLGADDLEYTVGTDGYYRMSVMFDLDEWK